MQSNRFQAFSDSEGDMSEEEVSQKQNRPVDPRSRAEKRKQQKAIDDKTITHESKQVATDGKKQKFQRDQKQPKGVSAEPHPQDKHSGSGLKTHDRKGGAGKGNWGTYKDDVQKEDNTQDNENQDQEVEEVEEEQLTYAEYMQKMGGQKKTTTTQQKKPTNVDYSEFTKEGCQVIEKVEKVDDKNPTKKKTINDTYIGMQNTELLGFRTGIKTYALREEKPREERDVQSRKPKQEEKTEKVEKVEGQEDVQENKEQREEQPKKQYNNNRGGRNSRGGYKGGEKRGNYNNKAPQKTSVKVNLEDDSLFPKLG